MKIAFLTNNRATLGRTKALYDHLSWKHDCRFILGCSAWDAKVESEHRIQSLMSGDDNESMFLTAMSYGTQLISHLRMVNPDLVIVHGDRYEQLVAAQAAAYLNIPLAHTEGGDISGSIDNKVRWAITALSDIHFPISEQSYCRLVNHTDRVYEVGSVGVDLVRMWEEKREKAIINDPYVVVLHHPDTVTQESIEPVISGVLEAVGAYRIIWLNPNVDPGSQRMLKSIHKQNVDFRKNLPTDEFFNLLKYADLCVGNSSSFIKECAYLGKNAVLIGSRQNGREVAGNVLRAKNEKEDIVEKIHIALEMEEVRDNTFGDGYACTRIQKVLDSL